VPLNGDKIVWFWDVMNFHWGEIHIYDMEWWFKIYIRMMKHIQICDHVSEIICKWFKSHILR